jgi:hypothetical protein
MIRAHRYQLCAGGDHLRLEAGSLRQLDVRLGDILMGLVEGIVLRCAELNRPNVCVTGGRYPLEGSQGSSLSPSETL